MIILGIDPGYGRTGYAVLRVRGPQRIDLITYGCIETAKTLEHHKRLTQLDKEVRNIIVRYKPDLLAIEKLFFVKNVTTALRVGEARGVVLAAVGTWKMHVVEFSPAEVKQAVTGYGNATKMQIQRMTQKLFNLKKMITPDDAADAVAIAWAASSQKHAL
ncbi:MAG: crossover junction endodeoxyribonuclease RuvC [Patescibacteria group bacterium]|jgi:crossover junction endodeoxyribonuclease RuvC